MGGWVVACPRCYTLTKKNHPTHRCSLIRARYINTCMCGYHVRPQRRKLRQEQTTNNGIMPSMQLLTEGTKLDGLSDTCTPLDALHRRKQHACRCFTPTKTPLREVPRRCSKILVHACSRVPLHTGKIYSIDQREGGGGGDGGWGGDSLLSPPSVPPTSLRGEGAYLTVRSPRTRRSFWLGIPSPLITVSCDEDAIPGSLAVTVRPSRVSTGISNPAPPK